MPRSGGSGEAVDMYIYLTANDNFCDGTVAWSVPCLFDPTTSQPRIGAVNLCPGSAYLMSTDREAAIAALMHQMMHVLVGRFALPAPVLAA